MAHTISPDLIAIQDEIRFDFGWSLEADLNSARELREGCELKAWPKGIWSDSGRNQTLLDLQERLISGPITVLGAAATAEDVNAAIDAGHGIIAADGAVGVLTEVGFSEIVWNSLRCVVSDADGDDVHLANAAERGVPFILHAHGDNSDEWRTLLDVLYLYKTPLIITHQTPEEIIGMHNPGGFTDGDRAVCFALSMNVSVEQLTLRGFATDHIGKWTGSTNPKQKMRKLEWMARVLELAGVKW
ncbi:MAG: hypothetical protein VX627_04190 [Candidatus Thermoplasmatota archaeon]|nr:hypothetical protein [Candidatus Thermoplasmatota archaeon]